MNRHIGNHASGIAGEQKDAIGQPDHLVDVVADEKCRHRPARDKLRKLGAQARRQLRIEGDEGFVEHQQFGLDRKRARQCGPAREAERELAGIMAPVSGQPERVEQPVQYGVARLRRGEAHVLLDGAPRQQPRFLEHDAEPAVRRQPHGAFEVRIEPGNDAKQRGLAAAGRTDQRRDLSARDSDRESAEHLQITARGFAIGFMLDVNFKPVLVASARHIVQTAAPGMFR